MSLLGGIQLERSLTDRSLVSPRLFMVESINYCLWVRYLPKQSLGYRWALTLRESRSTLIVPLYNVHRAYTRDARIFVRPQFAPLKYSMSQTVGCQKRYLSLSPVRSSESKTDNRYRQTFAEFWIYRFSQRPLAFNCYSYLQLFINYCFAEQSFFFFFLKRYQYH